MSEQDEPTAEDFLAAPETVRRSESELRKARIRKAREAAEEEQLRSQKSPETPSVEDLIEDAVRVAGDRDTNPMGWRFKQLSRKRYREYGHYAIEFVDQQFGHFSHFLEVAGLRDAIGTRRKKAAITRQSRMLHASRYLEREVLPYRNAKAHFDRPLFGSELVLSISDTHAMFLDPWTWFCFLQAIRDLRPDLIVFNGDILEGSEISGYDQIPGWSMSLADEFAFVREMFRQTRAIAGPDVPVVWTAGNHGLDRLARYLTQVARPFASLPSMRFDKLAGIEEHDVMLSQGGTIASPEGTEEDSEGFTLYGFYRIYHGRKLGTVPSLQELLTCGMSGQSGHVHRGSVVYGTTEAVRGLTWMSTPMGCTHRAGRAYMRGTTTGWQRGFGVAHIHADGSVQQYPVVTEGDVVHVEGYSYRRPDDIIVPDVSTNWLEGMELPKL